MSDTEELKPCPCGRPLLLRKTAWGVLYVMGEGCCSTEFSEKFDRHAIISACNKRAVPPPGVETEGVEAAQRILLNCYGPGDRFIEDDATEVARALLSTSSRGEDLSSRDKRASLPASDGRLLIAAHTKGQWFVADNDGTTGYGPHDVSAKLIRTDGGYVVAAVMTDTKDLRESTNAELLAGAPDLWDALQSIAANTCCKPCQEAALVARSALAKIGAPVGSQASE